MLEWLAAWGVAQATVFVFRPILENPTRVCLQRVAQIVENTQKVDRQPARLVTEDLVHPRNRLHQVMLGQRLVEIHPVHQREAVREGS